MTYWIIPWWITLSISWLVSITIRKWWWWCTIRHCTWNCGIWQRSWYMGRRNRGHRRGNKTHSYSRNTASTLILNKRECYFTIYGKVSHSLIRNSVTKFSVMLSIHGSL